MTTIAWAVRIFYVSKSFNLIILPKNKHFNTRFCNTYVIHCHTILSMNDAGESAKKGSLLVATYGEGYYIYTGLSFFRELPAGVLGAYKLFSNILSIGRENIKERNQIKQ